MSSFSFSISFDDSLVGRSVLFFLLSVSSFWHLLVCVVRNNDELNGCELNVFIFFDLVCN